MSDPRVTLAMDALRPQLCDIIDSVRASKELSDEQRLVTLVHSAAVLMGAAIGAHQRVDPSASPKVVGAVLMEILGEQMDMAVTALEALWGLNLSGGFDSQMALQALGHTEPGVREWAVRLAGDDNVVSPILARKLAAMAKTEPDVEVRSQLACSARTLLFS